MPERTPKYAVSNVVGYLKSKSAILIARRFGGRERNFTDQPLGKWEVYEQILRIPYYVIFSCYTNRLQVFGLAGSRYQERPLAEGKIWLSELGLGLGV